MSEHVFSEIYLHITWHTKESTPSLTPAVEEMAYQEIKHKCMATDGVYFQEIGGNEMHTHLAIAIEPTVLIAKFIGQLKGASSFLVNKQFGEDTLEWQPGYGIVSFSKRDLPWVLNYIRNQKEHHKAGTLSEKLEIAVGK